MSLLISGILSVIVGVIGFIFWWNDFVIILKGGIPIMLILFGVLAVYVGLDAMQDRMKEERRKIAFLSSFFFLRDLLSHRV